MSQKTIQCHLVAKEPSRKNIWQLTAGNNTPLINELLSQIAKDTRFEEWYRKGSVPQQIIKEEFCKPLRSDSRFEGQPGRFYTSAIATVSRIFKSWIRLHRRLIYQLEGQTRWLLILQSDEELTKACNCDLETLRTTATEILSQTASQSSKTRKARPGKKIQEQEKSQEEKSQFNKLFELYRNADDNLTRGAIAYLLKNGGKLPDKSEDPKKFAKRRRKAEIRVERLTNTLKRMRSPSGRDLTDQKWLKTLATAASSVPADEDEAALWQAILLSETSKLPFPVTYETNEDLTWFLNDKGRLCVTFNGLSEHTFEIYCDQRQLHWFKRFLEDQEIKKASKDQHSSGLFTLRSARIAWQEGESKGNPWNVHRLVLFCTVETRSWTAEGTEQVRQEKATEYAKVIASTKAKGNLNKKQEQFIQSREKTIVLMKNPFPRPSRPLYQGQPTILAGVSYGLDRPATLAIIDITTGKAITYRSIRQLLGDCYELLNRYRLRQQQNAHRRHNRQRAGASNKIQESNLGEYLDCLIAQAVVSSAQAYQVSSIILPDLGNIQEMVEAKIQARAEYRIVGYLEGQQQYAKQYRASVHCWSYGRLTEKIQSQSAQVGIVIEQAKQLLQGTPQEKAKNLAIEAYKARK